MPGTGKTPAPKWMLSWIDAAAVAAPDAAEVAARRNATRDALALANARIEVAERARLGGAGYSIRA